ncbi:uncharacterized protein B0P05DRAFT_550718 [Gilbertella persicaria]|uniref:uncharacterized protein n=1 Tax=Gilbertella persicaria TaxID=101096 RepID=UPI002220E732|nr:uncharacterized protein B0P05DRAFT_550718 [Gilbertella persicaria]KAI8069752.1 hypothetical protein B0P05DRAFT_550718 [Gilbertella persicaria]
MPLEENTTEPRRKRAKIVSACGECRRKKTKCNGEHPCRNCEKSGVPCIYPSASTTDDRRNAPSKQALDAIEERLKTIEDMLRTIIKAQHLSDAEHPLVSHFLSRDSVQSSSSSVSSPPRIQTTPPPLSPSLQNNRLPSIRNLSASTFSANTAEPKLDTSRDLPPLGFHQNYAYPHHPSTSTSRTESDEFLKKRKR